MHICIQPETAPGAIFGTALTTETLHVVQGQLSRIDPDSKFITIAYGSCIVECCHGYRHFAEENYMMFKYEL